MEIIDIVLVRVQEYSNDLSGFVLSIAVIASYHVFLRFKLKQNRLYTLQAVNKLARTVWVRDIMKTETENVVPVQTLRNAIMGATLMASTAVLLMVGTLTLTSQGHLQEYWEVLNIGSSQHPELWLVKLLFLLLDLLVPFVCFSQAIRLFIHVGFMINVSVRLKLPSLSPRLVAKHLNRAGRYYSVGMRAYYFAVPLIFWLFGPHFMLLASFIVVIAMYNLDRAPVMQTVDYEFKITPEQEKS